MEAHRGAVAVDLEARARSIRGRRQSRGNAPDLPEVMHAGRRPDPLEVNLGSSGGGRSGGLHAGRQPWWARVRAGDHSGAIFTQLYLTFYGPGGRHQAAYPSRVLAPSGCGGGVPWHHPNHQRVVLGGGGAPGVPHILCVPVHVAGAHRVAPGGHHAPEAEQPRTYRVIFLKKTKILFLIFVVEC